MTTKEMIEVMQAYERGEQIEYREKKIVNGYHYSTTHIGIGLNLSIA